MASVHCVLEGGNRVWPSPLKTEEKAIFFALLQGYSIEEAEAKVSKIEEFLDRAGIQRTSWSGRIRCQYIINHLMGKTLFVVASNFWKGQGNPSNCDFLVLLFLSSRSEASEI